MPLPGRDELLKSCLFGLSLIILSGGVSLSSSTNVFEQFFFLGLFSIVVCEDGVWYVRLLFAAI